MAPLVVNVNTRPAPPVAMMTELARNTIGSPDCMCSAVMPPTASSLHRQSSANTPSRRWMLERCCQVCNRVCKIRNQLLSGATQVRWRLEEVHEGKDTVGRCRSRLDQHNNIQNR